MSPQERVARFGYVPFAKQVEAHAAPEDTVFMAGGWGSGKTRWLVAEAIRNTAKMPGVPGMLVSPTYQLQRRTLQRTLVEMLPEAKGWPTGHQSARERLGPMVRDWSSRDNVLTLWNGTEWFFGSAEVPGSLEGVNVGWLAGDEVRLWRHEAWRIANARVRHPAAVKHRRSLAGVPSMGWLWEEFGRGIEGRRVVHASSLDNPYLPRGYVRALGLSDRMAQAYVHGQFVVMEGVVYWTYDPRDAALGGSLLDVRPHPDRVTFGALDFGGRSPWFGLVQDVSVEDVGDGVRVVDGGAQGSRSVDVFVEEHVGSDTLEAVHARECAALCKRHGVTLGDVFVDPGGNQRNAQTGMKSIQIYRDAFLRAGVLRGGLRWTRSPIEVHIPNGVETLRGRLQDAFGTRHTFVASALAETERTNRYPAGKVGIHGAFLGYCYPTNQPGSDTPRKDGTHDHPCDGARYYAINRWGVLTRPERAAYESSELTSTPQSYAGGLDDAF